MEILPQEISVVVQGPVIGKPQNRDSERLTLRCLKSIRTHLIGAEIILSTWEGEDISGLTYDKVLFNRDPGNTICHRHLDIYNNVNRQIVSTKNGLFAATKKYALKIRSDLVLKNSNFLKYFKKFEERNERYKILKDRILVCSVFSKNPRRVFHFPYHPSDWFHFGLAEDVLNVWDIPLAPEPETSRWFESHPRPNPDLYPLFLHRYLPEQYIWMSFLKKHTEVSFDYIWDCGNGNLEKSELSIVNNLVILEPWRLGIRSCKYGFNFVEWLSLYSFGEWKSLYRKKCDTRLIYSSNFIYYLKNLLLPLSYIAPLRLSRSIIWFIFRRNENTFTAWETKSPGTYALCLKLYRWISR